MFSRSKKLVMRKIFSFNVTKATLFKMTNNNLTELAYDYAIQSVSGCNYVYSIINDGDDAVRIEFVGKTGVTVAGKIVILNPGESLNDIPIYNDIGVFNSTLSTKAISVRFIGGEVDA